MTRKNIYEMIGLLEQPDKIKLTRQTVIPTFLNNAINDSNLNYGLIMVPEIRKKFNNDFSEKVYQEFLDDLNSVLKYPTDFRVCETPVFLSGELTSELIKACDDVISSDPAGRIFRKIRRCNSRALKSPESS